LRSAARYILAAVLVFTSQAGADFPVNVRTSLNQANPAVAADPNGNFVVVWHSYYQDNSNEIIARLFSKEGLPLGDEFRINQTRTGNQKEPAVAMDAAGNFMVLWQGPGDDGDDIWCRRFDAGGAAITDEFIVNTSRTDDQLSPEIAMNSFGRHIIVWESNSVPHPGARAICGQIFDSNDSKVGGELVLSDGNDICRYPAVALGSDANAVVVWVKGSAAREVRRRRFIADGNAPSLGSFKVNDSPNFNSLTRPAVAMDPAGNFVIAWDGHPSDHDQDDIYLRPYHPTGAGNMQYQVNDGNDGAQRYPAMALYDGGQLLILWEGDSGDNNSKQDIFGRRLLVSFTHLGEPVKIGDEFRLNTYLYQDQQNIAVTGRSDKTFVGAWHSESQDGSDKGIFAAIGPVIGTADLDGDGFVDFMDFSGLGSQWKRQGGGLAGNLVNDNEVDLKDIAAFCEQWLTYRYPCEQTDISGEGGIDFRDFSILAAGWRNYGPADGDIDGNGVIDGHDLQWLTLHWARSCE
jgi:hypothetical protein